METIPKYKKSDPGDELVSTQGVQESIYPNHHEENVTDGSEFLDDAIRKEDQLGEETTSMETE